MTIIQCHERRFRNVARLENVNVKIEEMIKGITYNWFISSNGVEDFTNRTVGIKYGQVICTEIKEHSAKGEADKWYYDICYSDGTVQRVFNPNEVLFLQNED